MPKHPTIPAKWRKLFKLIPGYDPVLTAATGDWFDPKAAQTAIDFIQMVVKHAKGAKAGKLFLLELWQVAVVGCLFGWKRKDGTRRYRECLLYVAKKNGKSALAAAIILYMLTQDDEIGSEIYSAAATREQAAIIFSHAIGMVKQSPKLNDMLTIYGGKGGSVSKSIVFDRQMSSYKCLAADANTVDGVSPCLNVVDELHRHKTPDLAEILHKSTAAREQPLTLYTTTADYNRESLCNTVLKQARAVRDNPGDPDKPGYDSAFLPVIFECSADDDWRDPVVWRKANPNLGITIEETFFAREVKTAEETPSKLNSFLRLNLNIVTDADVAYLSHEQWDACEDETCTDNLEGRACFAGLDASTTLDVTALVLLFPGDEGAYTVKPYFWIPSEGAEKRERLDHVPYRTWARGGHLEMTDGNVIDYDVIRKRINELGETHNIEGIAIDRWNTTQLQTQLIGDGFDVVKFGQGFGSMTAPTKELEALVVSESLHHDGDPVLRWMAGNIMVETDAAGNRKPSKDKSSEKIDGMVALIMALGIAMVAEVKKASKYETQGLVFV
jgi:phage terminase large subunit-like protein